MGGRADRGLRLAGLLVVLAAAVAGLLADEPFLRGSGDADARELVVVVHGLGRSRASMAPMARTLERAGYRVVNWGYSARDGGVPEIGAALAARARREARSAPRVHFVAHSLGNVLVRWTLAHDPPPRPGRVVMLAPPNRGSASADRWTPWLGWFLRPLPDLRTDSASAVRRLPAEALVEVGVIAGRYDAKVSVEETRLPGARAHAVVPAAHTWIMNRADVRRMTVRFLRTGRFGSRATDAPPPFRTGD